MFRRKKLKELAKYAIEAGVIVSLQPSIEVIEVLDKLFGREVLGNLIRLHFSKSAHDPVIMAAVKKVLNFQTMAFINDLVDLMEEDSRVEYTKTKCEKCGSRMYRIKLQDGVLFCLSCDKRKEQSNEK